MKWTEEVATRFSELRQKELAGTLSIEEKGELATLFAVLEADEKQYLAGAMTRLREEDTLVQTQIELTNGTLIGLTERGWFHINWLHLNRPQLIGFRQLRLQRQNRDTPLQSLEAAYQRLYQRNAELEEEITWLQSMIRQLLSRP